jgi:transposase-like protein
MSITIEDTKNEKVLRRVAEAEEEKRQNRVIEAHVYKCIRALVCPKCAGWLGIITDPPYDMDSWRYVCEECGEKYYDTTWYYSGMTNE